MVRTVSRAVCTTVLVHYYYRFGRSRARLRQLFELLRFGSTDPSAPCRDPWPPRAVERRTVARPDSAPPSRDPPVRRPPESHGAGPGSSADTGVSPAFPTPGKTASATDSPHFSRRFGRFHDCSSRAARLSSCRRRRPFRSSGPRFRSPSRDGRRTMRAPVGPLTRSGLESIRPLIRSDWTDSERS